MTRYPAIHTAANARADAAPTAAAALRAELDELLARIDDVLPATAPLRRAA